MRLALNESASKPVRKPVAAASPDQVVGLVDHGDRCFLERHLETDILLQFGHETFTSGWRCQGTPTIAALAITPCPYRDPEQMQQVVIQDTRQSRCTLAYNDAVKFARPSLAC